MTMQVVSQAPQDGSKVIDSTEALAQMTPRFLAVPDDKQVTMNVDVPTIGTRMLAHADRIASLIPQAEATFKDFDPTPFREVALWAMALLQAHSQHKTTSVPPVDPLPGLGERAMIVRDDLMDAARFHARRGHIDPQSLTSIKGLVGYRNQASDLMGLSNVFKQSWLRLAGRTVVSLEEVKEAASLADAMFVALGERQVRESETSEESELRMKAYAFVFHGYNGIRRVVSYLRWEEGDADDFAPSLFAGRGGNHKGKKEEASEPSVPTQEKETPGTGGAAPIGGKQDAGGLPGGSPFIEQTHVPGQPGGSPFLR